MEVTFTLLLYIFSSLFIGKRVEIEYSCIGMPSLKDAEHYSYLVRRHAFGCIS